MLLPIELQEKIVNSINCLRDLNNLSLVNKRWSNVCRQRLFKNLVFTKENFRSIFNCLKLNLMYSKKKKGFWFKPKITSIYVKKMTSEDANAFYEELEGMKFNLEEFQDQNILKISVFLKLMANSNNLHSVKLKDLFFDKGKFHFEDKFSTSQKVSESRTKDENDFVGAVRNFRNLRIFFVKSFFESNESLINSKTFYKNFEFNTNITGLFLNSNSINVTHLISKRLKLLKNLTTFGIHFTSHKLVDTSFLILVSNIQNSNKITELTVLSDDYFTDVLLFAIGQKFTKLKKLQIWYSNFITWSAFTEILLTNSSLNSMQCFFNEELSDTVLSSLKNLSNNISEFNLVFGKKSKNLSNNAVVDFCSKFKDLKLIYNPANFHGFSYEILAVFKRFKIKVVSDFPDPDIQ
ncbi:hypothetical protein HK099_003337 [Clydaea vesicula]|uniref:F-box domain-containing protein n=1 Tax=Clydaea vesicula TaxID=447962 RepID=A0AAD5U7A4_9FUNG|nr:hypothetical protein HK099_003337 [Clydaea vesicula]KAJ3396015.1 hypothetical protein HDU92_004318 [Lobulomyces angularis]